MEACYDCAFKHLAEAYVVWFEIENGYQNPEHYLKFVGNLAQAEAHLVSKHPALAASIRECRKGWFDARVMGIAFNVTLPAIAADLWAAILTEEHDGEEKTN